ncbi:hypothetical protein SAMN05192560_0531 [Methylobacillus rhizosphaerae]|uniref:Lipoprotein n=1 Tax=Methylobacillus rhizosphaerae TaxID=551994 RepID=A0A238YDY9_9PROT|nr:hypothetical protein [Methylobacillus rhizosphaerae]SNR69357.1 hypothetical protein SAMN05192560_0531 [Methylobacillus rhizosphaerae]
MKFKRNGNYHTATVLLASIMLAACGGEFSYKRGAGIQDLNEARKQCQTAEPLEPEFTKCMENNGWLVHSPQDVSEDADPVIKASIKADYRNSAAATPLTESTSADHATTSPLPVKKLADPMDMFIVSSWWKTGKGADILKNDMQTCVAKLGEEHQPDMSGKTARVTRGLLLCMRDAGWKALQAGN